jgi:hypothetical protein
MELSVNQSKYLAAEFAYLIKVQIEHPSNEEFSVYFKYFGLYYARLSAIEKARLDEDMKYYLDDAAFHIWHTCIIASQKKFENAAEMRGASSDFIENLPEDQHKQLRSNVSLGLLLSTIRMVGNSEKEKTASEKSKTSEQLKSGNVVEFPNERTH